MRVVFPYVAQLHQVLHSLPIAAELALRHPNVEVHAAGASARHVDFVRHLLARYAPQARVRVDRLRTPLLTRWRYRKKSRLLLSNWLYFRSFDAIVTPERTSLVLRRFGLGRTRLIWTSHGAGDRAVGFAEDIKEFDYVVIAGPKLEQRLLAGNLIRPGHYATGVYAKFDWLRRTASASRLFDNDRPVVLYSPHFRTQLASWPTMGKTILNFFATHPEWNLIFAPHVRMFDPPTQERYQAFDQYLGLPNVRIDLGSEQSVDMTYLNAADLYLGDVSSQVAEFVCRPRPCLFLNAHGVEWRGDPNYRCWELGPVIDDASHLGAALTRALDTHDEFLAVQKRYVAETFGEPQGLSSSALGADAIVGYLESGAGVSRKGVQGMWRRMLPSGMS